MFLIRKSNFLGKVIKFPLHKQPVKNRKVEECTYLSVTKKRWRDFQYKSTDFSMICLSYFYNSFMNLKILLYRKEETDRRNINSIQCFWPNVEIHSFAQHYCCFNKLFWCKYILLIQHHHKYLTHIK